MMGKDKTVQESHFSYNVSLDARVRKDHVLRKIQQAVDFGFIYKEVEQFYGERGNVSCSPLFLHGSLNVKHSLLIIVYSSLFLTFIIGH
jgi:hypothetical protein